MSPQTSPIPQPEIVPVAAQRLSPAQMPNRTQRNSTYTELGTLNFGPEDALDKDKVKVRCYAHRQAGSLLFAFPDNSGYTLDTGLVGNQLYKYWIQTSVAAAEPPAGAEDPTPTH